jgi:DNA-binding NarL/FixJ family response regulator
MDGDGGTGRATYLELVPAPEPLYESSRRPLRPREREVLRLVADGFSNGEIAAHLYVSEETVKSEIRTILAALGARTRAHAVFLALRAREID